MSQVHWDRSRFGVSLFRVYGKDLRAYGLQPKEHSRKKEKKGELSWQESVFSNSLAFNDKCSGLDCRFMGLGLGFTWFYF